MANILQWNCHGLRTHAEQLKVLIRDHNPGIICLQETKIGNGLYNPGLNYFIYCSPPPDSDHAKGGAAVIVNRFLQHREILLETTLQAAAVSVVLHKRVTICSLPPTRSPF